VDTAADTAIDEVRVGTSPHIVAVHRSRPLAATSTSTRPRSRFR
jgi:hypothetical protein